MVDLMPDILISLLSLEWVAQQFYAGDALPFLIWTALMLLAGFASGRAYTTWRRFRTGRFTPRQVHVIYECYKSSFGKTGFMWLDFDNFEVRQLVEMGVMFEGVSRIRDGVEQRQCRLTPDWYEHVRRRQRRFRRLYDKSEGEVSFDRK